jgi:hypothetical protein
METHIHTQVKVDTTRDSSIKGKTERREDSEGNEWRAPSILFLFFVLMFVKSSSNNNSNNENSKKNHNNEKVSSLKHVLSPPPLAAVLAFTHKVRRRELKKGR